LSLKENFFPFSLDRSVNNEFMTSFE
jgi:hypothetical protein